MNEEARQYIDAVPEGKAHFEQLHALIMALYPDVEIGMSYRVPTYKAKSGWVAVGYWKNGISLYTNDPRYLNELTDRYPGIRIENGGINFKVADTIPLAVLKQVIRHAIEHPATEFTAANDVARYRRATHPHLQHSAENNA